MYRSFVRAGTFALTRGLLLASLVAMVLPAHAVATDHTPNHVGRWGFHELREPAARCAVRDSQLRRIGVQAPIVYAHDDIPGELDSQRVGWRYVIEAENDSGEWVIYRRSSIQQATATDEQPASFSSRVFRFTEDPQRYDNYRVRVRMLWYRAEVDGRADHWAERYRTVFRAPDGSFDHDHVDTGPCGTAYGTVGP